MSKKGKVVQFQPISLKNYIIDRARKLPFYKCWSIGDDENGMKQIVVSRQKANGKLVVGFYLVDYFCLGLKDTFYKEFDDEDELSDVFFENVPFEAERIEIDEVYAQNFIYGAIEFAEDHGFEPAKDFRVTEYLLDEVDDIEYMEIEFGDNGKVHYLSGPEDDIAKNLKILRENVGIDNFEFTDLTDEFGDEDEEDDAFDDEMDELVELEGDELVEKFKEIFSDTENETLNILHSHHIGIVLQIDKYCREIEYDKLLEKFKFHKDELNNKIIEYCILQDSEKETIFNTEVVKNVIQNLIENYLYYEGIHFILHTAYKKALIDRINNEESDELFKFFTSFKIKTSVWGLGMLNEISIKLYKIEFFHYLTDDQKDRALDYFFKEINNEKLTNISEKYLNFGEDFKFFKNEYNVWEDEDDLKIELLELGKMDLAD